MQLSCIYGMYFKMGDRVGPVGTVETESSVQGSGHGLQSANQSINLDRQEALVRFNLSL